MGLTTHIQDDAIFIVWDFTGNHPVKELIWVVQPDDNVSDAAPFGKQWFNYTDAYDNTYKSGTGIWTDSNAPLVGPGDREAGSMPGIAAGGANNVYIPVSFEDGKNPVSLAKLQLNGHDRFSERDGRYFNLVQPYQHHENVPSQGICVYSFGLKPEEHQPSGTCNMSRIDNATLQLTLTPATVASRTAKIRVYAVNYNVLRIMSGMGGLNVRAKKLYAMIIWDLIIDKSDAFPAFNNKREHTASCYKNSNIPCCGKILRTSSTKFKDENLKWLRAKRRYGNNEKDWMIRIFTKFKDLGCQRLNGCGSLYS